MLKFQHLSSHGSSYKSVSHLVNIKGLIKTAHPPGLLPYSFADHLAKPLPKKSVKECIQPRCFYTNYKLKEHDKRVPKKRKKELTSRSKSKGTTSSKNNDRRNRGEVAELTGERRDEALQKGRNRNEEL